MRVFITQKDKVKELFLRNKRFISEECQIRDGIKIIKKFYDGFYIIEVGDITTLYYIPEDSPIEPFNSHLEVTNNERYYIENIINGSLQKKDIIIEGSDGTGKTTVVNYFALNGILVQDRAVDGICVLMKEEVPIQERNLKVSNFLIDNNSKTVIFLYVSNEKELWNRVLSRENISEYDKKTLKTQKIYLETYQNIKNKCKNLFLIDTFNKTTEAISREILRCCKSRKL